MSQTSPAVVCHDLSFEWPDGTPVIEHLDTAFDQGRTGLIGVNGSGKSTLLALIAGNLSPTSGRVEVAGEVARLPQDLPLAVERTVADLLGITDRRAALHAIEAGDVAAVHFDVLGEDWDIEERAVEELAGLGLSQLADASALDRRLDTLSGGEAILVGIGGLRLRKAAVTLLDEPTNNLDRPARERLYAAVGTWPGVLIVVSHDRELLERVDHIADLRDGTIRQFGGTLSAYAERLELEQAAAARRVRVAEADVRREKRQLAEARTKLARRERYANTDFENKRRPKIIMQLRKREAQVSAGKHRIEQEAKLDQARAGLSDAESAVRDDDTIRIELPGTEVPTGRTVAEIDAPRGRRQIIRGPERIALLGANGSGKTTLLRAVAGLASPGAPAVELTGLPTAYLPQRLDVLDDDATVLDNVRAAAPYADPQRVRARLARFLLTGDRIDQRAGTLSGGERFRVALARLLLADPPPQLMVLDEPTNNLDLASVDQLADALTAYRGALIVASHDLPLLRRIGIDHWWTMDGGHGPVTRDELATMEGPVAVDEPRAG